MRCGSSSSQLRCDSQTALAMRLFNVRCSRSETELLCGRYATILIFSISLVRCNSDIIELLNSGPLSESNWIGFPWTGNTFSVSIRQTVTAVWSRIGNANAYFVKWSMMVRMYELDDLDLGWRPVMSSEILSQGSPARYECNPTLLGVLPRKNCAHGTQLSSSFLMSARNPAHYATCWILAVVLAKPKWQISPA